MAKPRYNAPQWHKKAVFYEVPVYAFRDSDGDGYGDFPGLISKLDYLQWLGVDVLWLLPFYESPLRDGGYDVADFRSVLPRYGTVADIETLLSSAHERGIRVIADMIVNHTSNEHPWFRDAISANATKRDWYVWSDSPDRYAEARVIFTDTHDSNWTWHDGVGAYYWHRFFHFQPDLNFDQEAVREEMKDVIRFWLNAGFDGLRLDAVPYLYEREGTSGENLPETHAYLKELRRLVDAEFPGRILLAEANQWPRDVVPYFGDDDECHMAFHFPLMPRLYIALAKQSAQPVIDILADTPPIPDSAQWGIFLRNHDELTLEMVTEEERAFMYERYAPDPTMRKNLGIRRRLAPLLGGDRRKIELLHGLLLSLPGSPFLYYGDEIGMGDEYLLDDRDGVRTPMQWTPSAGTGFSDADPADFYLPMVSTVGYSPAAVNVETQRTDPDSLLTWLRRMLSLRRDHPVLALGDFEPVVQSSQAVLSYVRRGADTVLVAANLAASDQVAELPVGTWFDLLSEAKLVGSASLGPYEFRWLLLRS